jgi:hypothetical protein
MSPELLPEHSAQGIIQYHVEIIGSIRPSHGNRRRHHPHCRQASGHPNTKTQPYQLQDMERPRRWVAGWQRAKRVHSWDSQETHETRPAKDMAPEQRRRYKHPQGKPVRKPTRPRNGHTCMDLLDVIQQDSYWRATAYQSTET